MIDIDIKKENNSVSTWSVLLQIITVSRYSQYLYETADKISMAKDSI